MIFNEKYKQAPVITAVAKHKVFFNSPNIEYDDEEFSIAAVQIIWSVSTAGDWIHKYLLSVLVNSSPDMAVI